MTGGHRIFYSKGHRKQVPSGIPVKRLLWKWGTIVVVLSLLAGAIYALFQPQWRIESIEVVGAESIAEGEIIARIMPELEGYSFFFIPRNSFFIPRVTYLEQEIKSTFPKIATIKIEKEFSNMLRVTVEERVVWGIFCGHESIPISEIEVDAAAEPDATSTILSALPPLVEDFGSFQNESKGTCMYIDSEGFAFDVAPISSGSIILKIASDEHPVHIAAEVFDSVFMQTLIAMISAIHQVTNSDVVGVAFTGRYPRDVEIKTAAGFALYLDRATDIDKTFQILRVVLSDEIEDRQDQLEYIDLRFGNKVFYKYR